jgi:hypothetical protein
MVLTAGLVLAAVGGSTAAVDGAESPTVAPHELWQPRAAVSAAESPVVARLSRAAADRPKVAEPVLVNGRQQPPVTRVPTWATGSYLVVPGEAKSPGQGPILRYLVEVERGLPFGARDFAAEVHRILNHEHGWGRAGRIRFVRVDSGAVRFRVSLSSPDLTDTSCAPLRTFGRLSCFSRGRAVINAVRWGTGSPSYGKDVVSYREYLISHEVGHGLGHGHVSCPKPGEPAPVMVQQTKSLGGCRPNPWPYP